MPNKTKFAKKGFLAVIALLLIIIMTPLTQGCPPEPPSLLEQQYPIQQELLSLRDKYSQLKEEEKTQNVRINNLRNEVKNIN